jgi:HlyD family secretion protein
MPVTITWDALVGKEWKGVVEKIPAQIVAFGTRQVGEVLCIIDNPGPELYPGANVNASIRSRSVENVLTIPKETLRRENGVEGVYLTAAGVLEGLKAGDAVLLPLERPIKAGMPVKPVTQ